MERAFLKELGIADESIEKIMEEYGKAVSKFKGDAKALSDKDVEIEGLKEQLKKANEQIKSFEEMNIDDIRQAARDWEEKAKNAEKDAEKKIAELQFEHILDGELSGAKARNAKAVRALLDMEGLKLNDGKIVGLSEQLEKIKSENDYLFDGEDGDPKFAGRTPGASAGNDDTLRAAMGLSANKN